MKVKLLTVSFCCALLQLSGCATQTSTQEPAPVIDQAPTTPEPAVQIPEVPAPVTTPTPQPKPAGPAPTSNAVISLVTQARAQYAAKNYQAAVATAERGLRIDRRSPELYLVLAQSYVQLANKQLAQQFVQQGIKYAQAGTEVAQSLIKVRDNLAR